eukprot:c1951_g1_i1.p1 GENE.c1951_g1_i1~~c1951_g1_i1.p1  ORF type:complete len:246 (+),score=81.83 c1951_g1_i1:24-740(+)
MKKILKEEKNLINTNNIPLPVSFSWFIESICSENKKSVDSVFKCVTPVQISIGDYGQRLGVYMRCDSSSFVIAAIFIEKLFKTNPEFFCPLSAHKLMCTSLLLGVKYNQDVLFGNKFYSEIFGVTLSELNLMESVMLRLLKFKLFVSSVEYCDAKSRLIKMQSLQEEINLLKQQKSIRQADFSDEEISQPFKYARGGTSSSSPEPRKYISSQAFTSTTTSSSASSFYSSQKEGVITYP